MIKIPTSGTAVATMNATRTASPVSTARTGMPRLRAREGLRPIRKRGFQSIRMPTPARRAMAARRARWRGSRVSRSPIRKGVYRENPPPRLRRTTPREITSAKMTPITVSVEARV